MSYCSFTGKMKDNNVIFVFISESRFLARCDNQRLLIWEIRLLCLTGFELNDLTYITKCLVIELLTMTQFRKQNTSVYYM